MSRIFFKRAELEKEAFEPLTAQGEISVKKFSDHRDH